MKMDDTLNVKVTGVYEDLPYNSTLRDVSFMAPWSLYMSTNHDAKHYQNDWGNNGWLVYVQVAENADMNAVSEKIRNAKLNKADKAVVTADNPVFLQPMSRWHLYSEFKNGVNAGDGSYMSGCLQL